MRNSEVIKTIINSQKPVGSLASLYVDVSDTNRHGFFNIEVYRNKKEFLNKQIPIAHSSFKINFDHIRAVEDQDFTDNLAIPGYHQGLFVEPEYRRQKIATMIYLIAEKITELPLQRSNDITQDSLNFWNQPNRPFGIEDL